MAGNSPTFIAVMGVTGSGKSSFVKTVTRNPDITIGHGLLSSTEKVCSYKHKHETTERDHHFVLIDTPGFNDTLKDERQILEEIAAYLRGTCGHNPKLNGILYLHPITHARASGSTMNNFRMFKALCGDMYHKNIILATTFNTHVTDDVRQQRVQELCHEHNMWGSMIKNGAEVVHLSQDRDACIDVLMEFVSKDAAYMQIQVEQAQGLDVHKTSAGRTITRIEELRAVVGAGEASLKEHRERQKTLLEESSKRHADLEKQLAAVRLEEDTRYARVQREAQIRNDVQRREQRNSHYRMLLQVIRSTRLSLQMDDVQFITIVTKTCNRCLGHVSTFMSYHCYHCREGDFDVCYPCYNSGIRCYDESHEPLARQKFVGTSAGRCRRMSHPPGGHNKLPCNICKKIITSIYFHCCKCDDDNFDICLNCAIAGKTCLDKSHKLQVLRN